MIRKLVLMATSIVAAALFWWIQTGLGLFVNSIVWDLTRPGNEIPSLTEIAFLIYWTGSLAPIWYLISLEDPNIWHVLAWPIPIAVGVGFYIKLSRRIQDSNNRVDTTPTQTDYR